MKKPERAVARYTVILITLCVMVAAFLLYSLTAGGVEREGDVYVSTDASFEELIDSLETGRGGRIANISLFRVSAKILGLKDNVISGRYRLTKEMSHLEAIRMFKAGLQTPVKVTFNNIRTLPQLAGRVAAQIKPDSAMLASILTADSTARRYGFASETFIAMFVPDTYEFYWNVSPAGFLDRMKKEYDRFWNADRLGKLEGTGLSRMEAVTLASIVYEETKKSDEMSLIAGVYMNRLRMGMALQADPTVKFALGDFSLRRVLGRHLEADSPYNTYMYAGLPPGPICMPSVQAVDAVLNYKRHDYIYFCARPDFSGYHNFAATFEEHGRNSAAYRAALNSNGIR